MAWPKLSNEATSTIAKALSQVPIPQIPQIPSLQTLKLPTYSALPQVETKSPTPSEHTISRSVSFSDLKNISGTVKSRRLLRFVLIGSGVFIVIIIAHFGLRRKQIEEPQQPEPSWRDYPSAKAYYHGLKKLVPFSEYVPEYPQSQDGNSTTTGTANGYLPTPTAFNPYPKYDSSEYLAEHAPVTDCLIDYEKNVPAPHIYAYDGIPQSQANPAIGSYDLLGLSDDHCYDRFGRYGPYGLGYRQSEGGLNAGSDTENSNAEQVWDQMGGKINYKGIDWQTLQEKCYELNRERFTPSNNTALKATARSAVVIRIWDEFPWHELVAVNFRAMINELNLKSGGEFDVHFLLHAKDNELPIWASDEIYQTVVNRSVPEEFRNMVTLWQEKQMEVIYNHPISDSFDNPSGQNLYGALRSLHMPLQYFAHKHPEYEHFWNWEMDMRYTGHFYELFDRLGAWARAQPRKELWERSAKYYIPSLHGDWENFSKIVSQENKAGNNTPIFGPVTFPGSPDLTNSSYMPPSCAPGQNEDLCGVGEEADLITLNPLFDPNGTDWVFRDDVAGYNKSETIPPRRIAIVTAGRLSRRLLNVMHEETYKNGHSMFAEMFPATMALHHGLKAVYVPHPVFLDRKWPAMAIEKAFNSGAFNTSGGAKASPFSVYNEHYFQGTTWYYNSGFAGALWRRWLGYVENDEGGKKFEQENGRMCLRGVLVHPIKQELGSVEIAEKPVEKEGEESASES